MSAKCFLDSIKLFGGFTMAAGAWTFPDGVRQRVLNGTFDFDSDSFKMALFDTTSNIGAATTTYAGVTNETANANGYTTGGIALATFSLTGTTSVKVTSSTAPVWTASGGSIVGRYAVIYEVGGDVVCYSALDAANITVTAGNTLTVTLDPTNGIFRLA